MAAEPEFTSGLIIIDFLSYSFYMFYMKFGSKNL